jgi:hypothetical protein
MSSNHKVLERFLSSTYLISHGSVAGRDAPGCSGWNCLNDSQQFGIIFSIVVSALTVVFLYCYLFIKQRIFKSTGCNDSPGSQVRC